MKLLGCLVINLVSMENRVSFQPPSILSVNINWQDLVLAPINDGNYAEAFASADAIIDSISESLLRKVYSDFVCQDLINELHLLRSKLEFQGLTVLEILKNKTVIKQGLYERVLNFKKARNLILHNVEREYALIEHEMLHGVNTQEEYNNLAVSNVKKLLDEGKNIFDDLVGLLGKINKDDYFSVEFYNQNPRGKLSKQKYPK